MGKGAGAAGTIYDYYGTIAGGVCVGPVSGICSIIINGSEAWPRGTPWQPGINCEAGTLYVFDAQTWTCTTTHLADINNAPGSGLEGWTQYVFKYHGSASDDFNCYTDNGEFMGKVRIYWGTTAQTTDFYLQSSNNDGGIKGNVLGGDNHPPYSGLCYCVLIDFLLGEEIQSGPNVEIIVQRKPNQAIITSSGLTDGQANPAAVLCEVLTDENCLGLPAAMIDTTSFQAAANWLDSNSGNYHLSILLDENETIRSFLDKLIQHLDAWIRFNPSTQKIEFGIYEHGVLPSTYANTVTLTADCLTKHPKFDTTSWQGTYSRATVRYKSRQLAYEQTSVYADDPRAFFVLGTCRDQSLDRPYIAREGQALFHGREALRVIGHAQMNGTLEVRREFARNIRAGDFVFVNIDLEPNGATVYQYFRVKTRKIPPAGPITLEIFADNTLAAVPFSTPYPVAPAGPANVPAITQVRAIQAPEVLSGEFQAVIFLAQRPNNLIAGCQVYFDTARVLSVSVTSITSDGTGNYGIITFSAAPGTQVGDYIDVSCSGNATFNVSQAQVTAIGINTVTYELAAAMAPGTAGSGTITVADYYMTFSSIGTFPTFAACATLNAAVTATATAITLNVNTAQADADYFTAQFTTNDANNDTMLLVLVSLVGSGADANQIAESNGFGIVEICSVSTQALVSAGEYQLSVLRGRQGTTAMAWNTANTEAWLIPRSSLAYFTNRNFGIIAANRVNGTVPACAQFRFCPFTYVGQLALSAASNVQFRFPLKSVEAPSIAMSSPGGSTISNGGASLPWRQLFSGAITDESSDLVEVKILAQAPGEANPRTMADWNFAPAGSFTFKKYLAFDKAGSWTISIIARDADGLTTTTTVTATITGTATCAFPELFDVNGGQLLNGAGDYNTGTQKTVVAMIGWGNGSPNVNAYWAAPAQYIPFGQLSLLCTTPGASIQFYSTGIIYNGGVLSESAGPIVGAGWYATDYSAGFSPFHTLRNPGTTVVGGATAGGSWTVSSPIYAYYCIVARATAPGYADSPYVLWKIPLFI